MKKFFKYLREDKLLFRLFILAFLLISFTFIYAIINYSKLPPLLPVFNQLPWGQERLSITLGIFIPPFLVLIIFIFNIFASAFIYPRSPLLSRMFAVTSFLISLLTFLFIFRTVVLIA